MATIDELETRLAELEARLGPVPLAVPPVTIGEYADAPAPGSPIASAWAQTATRRTVHRFASIAAHDAAYPAATAGNGAVCVTTDTGVFWTVFAGVWIGSNARAGGQWRRLANQSVPPGAVTAISWDTEDVDWDGWLSVPNSTLTCPAGRAGIYAVTARLAIPNPGAGFIQIACSNAGSYLFDPGNASSNAGTASIVIPISVAETIIVNVYHLNAGNVNVTGRLDLMRVNL